MILNARIIPTSDFTFGVSVELPSGKYRHYKVTNQLLTQLIAKEVGLSQSANDVALEAVRARVKQDFGSEYELGFVNLIEMNDLYKFHATRRMIPLPDGIFSPGVIGALRANHSTTYQFKYKKNISRLPDFLATFLDRVVQKLAPPTSFVNRLISSFNRTLQVFYGVDSLWDDAQQAFEDRMAFIGLEGTDEMTEEEKKYNEAVKGKFFVPYVPFFQPNHVTSYSPTVYLARISGEEDLDKAVADISDDLDRMNALGLIFGSLSMPRVMELDNTVGNGKKVYAVFAFPLLNLKNFSKALKLDHELTATPVRNPEEDSIYVQGLRQLNIGTAVGEGETSGTYPYLDLVESEVIINNAPLPETVFVKADGTTEIVHDPDRTFRQAELEKAFLSQREKGRKIMEKKIEAAKNLTKQ